MKTTKTRNESEKGDAEKKRNWICHTIVNETNKNRGKKKRLRTILSQFCTEIHCSIREKQGKKQRHNFCFFLFLCLSRFFAVLFLIKIIFRESVFYSICFVAERIIQSSLRQISSSKNGSFCNAETLTRHSTIISALFDSEH